jgi:hypothetical protein
MGQPKKHLGGCHCGKVRYEVTTDLARVMECNCSICSKKGVLMAFVEAPQFKLVSGEGEITDYQFGKRHIHHTFCRVCGIHSFGWGLRGDKKMNFVNVRCLDDVDIAPLSIAHFDGKSL